MDGINSLGTIFSALLKGGAGFSVLILLAAALIWWRTRSGHTILSRIWAFFSLNRGRSTLKFFEQFQEKQAALLQFRFNTGLNVRTLRHMKRVIKWGKKNDEDIGDIKRCGGFFDLEKPGLAESASKIKWWWGVFPFLLAGLFFNGAVAATVIAVSERALVQLNETKKYMLLSVTDAKPFGGSGFKFASCAQATSQDTGFTARERQVICDAVNSSDISKIVNRGVQEQRWGFGVLIAIFLFAIAFFWRMYRETESARRMYERQACRYAKAAKKVVKAAQTRVNEPESP
ncbi:hypothetical protein GTP45_23070 [Pseudoduganella sp. FT55W]|uniref:Uncharacterized protein n=1 Tax=Duganella rivi TaxID=2666083 RepID=A0A7X4GU22_9BURK|nr:DUF6216 family protein [Duganella rivi]MYM69702.1 hypothetical protein [Duganella rivi]